MADVVLLIESDATVRQPLAEYLRECGFNVFEAVSGDEAVEALTTGRAEINVVLADVAITGFEFSRWMRIHHPALELVLVGSLEMAVEKAGSLCEDGPALAKPYEHHLVLDRIKRALASRARF